MTKRILFFVALLLCLTATAAQAAGYPTPVQRVTVASGGAPASVTTAAITTTNGNMFVAIVSGEVAFPATPVSDSKTNTWALAVKTTSGDSKVGIYYTTTQLGGSSHTFTLTPASADFMTITVIELANAATSSVLGSTNSATSGGPTQSSGNITAGSGTELFVGASGLDHGFEGAPVPSATNVWYTTFAYAAGASNEGVTTSYRYVNPGVTDQYSVTMGGAGSSEGAVVAGFKVAPSAGGTETAYTFVK